MIFTAPEQIKINKGIPSIFLAGTIDMGSGENWQKEIIPHLLYLRYNTDIYNPRRKDWNSEWKQDFENPYFFQQVMWELDAMNKADIIIMNFVSDSKSPITLLELGLHANSNKLFVVCPKEYYRSGNVHIICNTFSIPLFENIWDLCDNNYFRSKIR